MKVLIRDDDTCAFTMPEELERVYREYWTNGIPVNLSVTPFRIPGGIGEFDKNMHWGIPENLWGTKKELPLKSNQELVSFLKEKINEGQIDIALHGYYHLTAPDEYNFTDEQAKIPQIVGREYLYGKNLFRKTKEGKKYLEKILGIRINTFVPPGNAISKEGLKAIIKNNLNLVGVPSLYKLNERSFSINNYKNLFILTKWFFNKRIKYYPFPLNFGDHKEIMFTTLGPESDISEIYRRLELCNNVDGYFVFATHYHAFNRKVKSNGMLMKDIFQEIIEKLLKYNAEFITYKTLWGNE